jgi:hypothetical protein
MLTGDIGVRDRMDLTSISYNGTVVLRRANLNFNNTASVNVNVTSNGTMSANVTFDVNVSSLSTIIKQEAFTATANQTAFTLTNPLSPANVNYLIVNRNGVTLEPTTHYTLSGQTLTLLANSSVNDTIDVREFIGANIQNPSVILNEQFTSTANQSVFTLNNSLQPANVNYIMVFRNGLEQTPTVDYTLSGQTLTLTSNTILNDLIEVREFIGINVANGGFAAGANQQIQYNTNGSLDGNSNLIYNVANSSIVLSGNLIITNVNTGIVMALGAASAANSLIKPLSDQVTYSLLGRMQAGPAIQGRWDSATSNRYLSLGSYDNNQLYAEAMKIQNGLVTTNAGFAVINTRPTVDTTLGGMWFGGDNTIAQMSWVSANAAANAKLWDCFGQNNLLTFRAVNDPITAANNWLAVTRSGSAVTDMSFGSAGNNPTYQFLGTGTATFNGRAFFTGTVTTPSTATTGMHSGQQSAIPMTIWIESGAAANAKTWRMYSTSGSLTIDAVNDAYNATNSAIVISRSGSAIANVGFPSVTTIAGGTAAVFDGSNNLLKSSSSIRYKVNVETLWANVAYKALDLRPIWYRSNTAVCSDPSEHSYIGLLAEEVANIEPRLVTRSHIDLLDANSPMQIEGIQYDRLAVMLLTIVKDQQARIEALESKIKGE